MGGRKEITLREAYVPNLLLRRRQFCRTRASDGVCGTAGTGTFSTCVCVCVCVCVCIRVACVREMEIESDRGRARRRHTETSQGDAMGVIAMISVE